MKEPRDDVSPAPAGRVDTAPLVAPSPLLKKTLIVSLLVSLVVTLLLAAILAVEILLVAFAGVLLATFLRGLTDLVQRFSRLGPRSAYAATLALVVATIALFAAVLVPNVAEQIDELRAQLPRMLERAEAFLRERGLWSRLFAVAGEQGASWLPETAGDLASAGVRWFTFSITILVTGVFGAASPTLYQEGLVRLLPRPRRARAREVILDVAHALRWWLIGRAFAMALVGVSTAIVLALLDVRFALLLGLVAGLFTFVPYLGPIVAGVPIVALALLDGVQLALFALLAYTVIQLVEGYIADPLILQRLVYIPPVLTILAQVLLGTLIGIVGIAMATPLAAVLVVAAKVYRRDMLGEADP